MDIGKFKSLVGIYDISIQTLNKAIKHSEESDDYEVF